MIDNIAHYRLRFIGHSRKIKFSLEEYAVGRSACYIISQLYCLRLIALKNDVYF